MGSTAYESGYGAFLPQHKNEWNDREALRGQMVQQATYLSNMDATYAELDERARQFDASLSENQRQFDQSTKDSNIQFLATLDYKNRALSQDAAQFAGTMEFNYADLAVRKELGEGELDLGKMELAQKRAFHDDEMDFQEREHLDALDTTRDIRLPGQGMTTEEYYSTPSWMMPDGGGRGGGDVTPSRPSVYSSRAGGFVPREEYEAPEYDYSVDGHQSGYVQY